MKIFLHIGILLHVITLFSMSDMYIQKENTADTKVIFYQGVLSSQVQAAKYTGIQGFITTTNEHALCSEPIDIIRPEDVWVAPETTEISPRIYHETYGKAFYYACTAPLHTFSDILSRYDNRSFGITVQHTTLQNPTHTLNGHLIHPSAFSLGQEVDIADHKKRYEACKEQYPDAQYILMGVSKGAASTFNAYAKHKYDNVKLVVLEGCFDLLSHAIEEGFTSLVPNWLKQSIYRSLSPWTQHTPEGIAPIHMVNEFPHTTPVAFITSKADHVVPAVCTQHLVQALVDTGHPEVYLLELENSAHARYTMDDEDDANNYQSFMHALYKKYALPYIEEYAQAGAEILAKSLRSTVNS